VAGTAKGIASRADILRGASRGPAPRISSLKEFQNYLSYYFIIILFIVACNFYLHILIIIIIIIIMNLLCANSIHICSNAHFNERYTLKVKIKATKL